MGSRTGKRQGRFDHAGDIFELNQLADPPEVFQLLLAEIQHRDVVPKHPAARVHGDRIAFFRGGHVGQPLQGIGFVHFHPQAAGGFQDAGQFSFRFRILFQTFVSSILFIKKPIIDVRSTTDMPDHAGCLLLLFPWPFQNFTENIGLVLRIA